MVEKFNHGKETQGWLSMIGAHGKKKDVEKDFHCVVCMIRSAFSGRNILDNRKQKE